jgi:hypothetical protein
VSTDAGVYLSKIDYRYCAPDRLMKMLHCKFVYSKTEVFNFLACVLCTGTGTGLNLLTQYVVGLCIVNHFAVCIENANFNIMSKKYEMPTCTPEFVPVLFHFPEHLLYRYLVK